MFRRNRSVARQLLMLQALLSIMVLTAAGVGTFAVSRERSQAQARRTVLALAESVAANPLLVTEARTTDPSAVLEPYAETVRRAAHVDFVVIMAPDRTRWTHPDVSLIGQPFVGTIAPALAGRAFTETFTGSLGPSVRAVAPVRTSAGTIVALVAVGITTEAIHAQLIRQLPLLIGAVAVLLSVALLGALLVSRRLRRQTRGLDAAAITRIYEYHEAVLHAVREGLVVVDRQGRVAVVNDEARRLLALPAGLLGVPVAELDVPESIQELLVGAHTVHDEVHLTEDRILLVNQSAAVFQGRAYGTVTTLRDRTELEELTGELDTTQAFAESLRAQAHESANRLHVMVILVETGRYEQAVEYATTELELSQRLADRVLSAVEEPVLAALILGKSAQASERGVELVLSSESAVPAGLIAPRDLVTVFGNLLDNAIDASAESDDVRRVEVTLRADGHELLIQVADSGAGIPSDQVDLVFTRGWSTKADRTGHGRGLGLALVGQVVRRRHGTIDVGTGASAPGSVGGAVFTVRLPLEHLGEQAMLRVGEGSMSVGD